MIAIVLLCLAAMADPPTAEDLKAYEAKKAAIGRDAGAHVGLAVWCGDHGMPRERSKHLGMALLIDPRNARARELMGRPPVEPVDPAREAALAEYAGKRAKAQRTADSHWALALWCEKNSLKDEETVELAEVVRLDPKREQAWKRLGFKKYDGRWMDGDQIAAAEAQKKADREWGATLKAIHQQIHRPKTKVEAEAALARVDDPAAVPAILREFGGRGPGDQAIAIQALGQIKGVPASKALAYLAVYGRTADVRRRATESLRGRDAAEFLDALVAMLLDPIRFEVRPVGGPGSPGVLFVEGERANLRMFYAPPPPPDMTPRPGDLISYDQFGMPIIIRNLTNNPGVVMQSANSGQKPQKPSALGPTIGTAVDEVAIISAQQEMMEAQRATISANAQLRSDVGKIESLNTARKVFNRIVRAVIQEVTGKDEGESPQAWRDMLARARPYPPPETRKRPKPILDQLANLAYNPNYVFLGTYTHPAPVDD